MLQRRAFSRTRRSAAGSVIAGELRVPKAAGDRLKQLHQPRDFALGDEVIQVPSPCRPKVNVPSTGSGP
jgi:hypothetical protein